MANYSGTARSNYFKVRNAAAFKAAIDAIAELAYWETNGTFAVYSCDPDTGCWPSVEVNPDAEETETLHMADILAPHLGDGEVVVLMQTGHEKLRYLSAHAEAFDNTGKMVRLALSDIYDKAKEAFGVEPNPAEY